MGVYLHTGLVNGKSVITFGEEDYSYRSHIIPVNAQQNKYFRFVKIVVSSLSDFSFFPLFSQRVFTFMLAVFE
jgi:hypothetical protein